ncbi:helix-turn-helix domain-containing protein [Streptomyces sp. NA04227]|uniref:helix-turn-helix domain-containing protein n=1 Tax=Streptomyces sp. NA04227 TaxID=2742136 RepID=UPI0015906F2F|nr:helix-turn-helix transcriptional regulator [Streptomyces sp. NA04227]QKW06599.1 helix-turn-helix domain-containing protein [Streptomyces sp. NA04227]
MSGATGATGSTGATGDAEAFAELLRQLKERSGLSYGALAKRLHMSTSTLHRYCNGSAVPADYAPVERLARVCRASPDELVALHRRWILADAARGRKGSEAGGGGPSPEAGGRASSPEAGGGSRETGGGSAEAGGSPEAGGGSREAREGSREAGGGSPETHSGWPEAAPNSRAGSRRGPSAAGNSADGGGAALAGTDPGTHAGTDRSEQAYAGGSGAGGAGSTGDAEDSAGGAPFASSEPLVGTTAASARVRPRKRRTALLAAVASAAVLGIVVLTVTLPSGDDGGGGKASGTVGPTADDGIGVGTGPEGHGRPSGSASPSPSKSGKTDKDKDEDNDKDKPSAPATEAPANGGGADDSTGGAAVNVATRPFVYESPCSQHFLVDSEPEQVGPPATEPNAPRWAAAYGAVSSGEQRVALTVQGTGKDTVVLEALHVRILSKGAPLAWNDYSMGVGCGGNVDTKVFDVDLDNGSPSVTVKGGQRDFPYKVSESDPEVFYVNARTKAHDVRWDLTLEWSSGNRRGTVHIDNAGTPFRTSANSGRPGYDYPLGASEWSERVDG